MFGPDSFVFWGSSIIWVSRMERKCPRYPTLRGMAASHACAALRNELGKRIAASNRHSAAVENIPPDPFAVLERGNASDGFGGKGSNLECTDAIRAEGDKMAKGEAANLCRRQSANAVERFSLASLR